MDDQTVRMEVVVQVVQCVCELFGDLNHPGRGKGRPRLLSSCMPLQYVHEGSAAKVLQGDEGVLIHDATAMTCHNMGMATIKIKINRILGYDNDTYLYETYLILISMSNSNLNSFATRAGFEGCSIITFIITGIRLRNFAL